MQDRQVGMWFAWAAAAWTIALALVIGGGVLRVALTGRGSDAAGSAMMLGLVIAGAAITASTKHMLCRYSGAMQDAFNMGREVGREQSVRSLR